MISHTEFPSDLLADCTEVDCHGWREIETRITIRFVPPKLACVSLDLPDAPDRIAARLATGRIVLALASPSRKSQRQAALAAGVHEFLETGPIAPAQMEARLRLLGEGSALPAGIALDRQARRLSLHSQEISLTERETILLDMLMTAKGGFVPHAALLGAAWGQNATERQYLRVAINRLRRRIEPEPDLPRYILSEPAIGYRIGTGATTRPVSHT